MTEDLGITNSLSKLVMVWFVPMVCSLATVCWVLHPAATSKLGYYSKSDLLWNLLKPKGKGVVLDVPVLWLPT